MADHSSPSRTGEDDLVKDIDNAESKTPPKPSISNESCLYHPFTGIGAGHSHSLVVDQSATIQEPTPSPDSVSKIFPLAFRPSPLPTSTETEEDSMCCGESLSMCNPKFDETTAGKTSSPPQVVDDTCNLRGVEGSLLDFNRDLEDGGPTFTKNRTGECVIEHRPRRPHKLPPYDPLNPKQEKQLEDAVHACQAGMISRVEDSKLPSLPEFRMEGLNCFLPTYQMLALGMMRHIENNGKGGLLCLGMGLGKTVIMLANIIDAMEKNKVSKRKKKPVLVVVPKSVAQQWIDEIMKHCDAALFEADGMLETVVGNFGRGHQKGSSSKIVFNSADIVVTTYGLVAKSWQACRDPSNKAKQETSSLLHGIFWSHVILDEGTAITGEKTTTSLACRELKTEHAWIMTGTPVRNKVEEYYAYFDFIGLMKKKGSNYFKENYVSGPYAESNLRHILERILLRMDDDTAIFDRPLAQRPEATRCRQYVDMGPAEAMIYNLLVTAIKQQQQSTKARGGMPVYLRQLSTSFMLVPQFMSGLCKRGAPVQPFQDLCRETMDPCPNDWAIARLKRIFVQLGQASKNESRSSVSPLVRYLRKCKASNTPPIKQLVKQIPMSAKMNAVVDIIQEIQDKGLGKTIVFVEFKGCVRMLKQYCDIRGWTSAIVFGDTDFKTRQTALQKFEREEKTRILIASIHCAAEGLNLQFASQVIIVDPWYNSALQDQAFARVNRPGQKVPTRCLIMIARGTYDEYLLKMQEEKEQRLCEIIAGLDEDFGTTKPPKTGTTQSRMKQKPETRKSTRIMKIKHSEAADTSTVNVTKPMPKRAAKRKGGTKGKKSRAKKRARISTSLRDDPETSCENDHSSIPSAATSDAESEVGNESGVDNETSSHTNDDATEQTAVKMEEETPVVEDGEDSDSVFSVPSAASSDEEDASEYEDDAE